MADIAFFDGETRSPVNLQAEGGKSYAWHSETEVLVWGALFDHEPDALLWSPEWCWSQHVDPEPTRLLDHIEDRGFVVAWNAFFDRNIWNAVMVRKYGWPALRLEQVLCAQAQAEGSNLPGGLAKAAECLGSFHKKDPYGKKLIEQLCKGTKQTWTKNFEVPEIMGRFRTYCGLDNLAMREIWYKTRPLTQSEWYEYHASERINDRGVCVDREFALAASQYASAEKEDLNARLFEISEDPKLTVTNHVRKARWLHDALWPDPEVQELTKRPPKGDKERFSADSSTREYVSNMLEVPEHAERFAPEQLATVTEVLELIEAGNSAASRKFQTLYTMSRNDRVAGCYAFNGAGQTGRYSSRGAQLHNMVRAGLIKAASSARRDVVAARNRAIDAIDDIVAGKSAEYLQAEYGFSLSRLLSRLTRPTFVAPEGRTLVWGDWDQIEARTLPWLSQSVGGDAKLDIFRSGQDVYKHAAQVLFALNSPDDATDDQRQVGKVSELSLGFGGSVGAFQGMAKNYGVALPEAQIKDIVYDWRVNNGWCVQFWRDLWDAAMAAHGNPGQWYFAGRVKYRFIPELMRGTLVCQLPCGRWLTYPQFRRQWEVVKDDDGNVMHDAKGQVKRRFRTTFVKAIGSSFARVDLWYGVLAENITQAAAASLLRLALTKLDDIIVLHTHDEVVAECASDEREAVSQRVCEVLEYVPDWAKGLPISVTMDHGCFYSK